MPTNTKQQLCIKPTGFLVERVLHVSPATCRHSQPLTGLFTQDNVSLLCISSVSSKLTSMVSIDLFKKVPLIGCVHF